MELLAAVNIVLRGSTKPAVNELDPQVQLSAYAERTINEARRVILTQGWPFNSRKVTLAPDVSGRIEVSKDYLDVQFPTAAHALQKDDAEDKLFVWNHQKNDWEREAIDDVEIVFDIGDGSEKFRTLPTKLALWITYKAASDFFAENNAGAVNNKLELKAIRAQSTFINGFPGRNLDKVTGFSRLSAVQAGGRTGSFDARFQTHM